MAVNECPEWTPTSILFTDETWDLSPEHSHTRQVYSGRKKFISYALLVGSENFASKLFIYSYFSSWRVVHGDSMNAKHCWLSFGNYIRWTWQNTRKSFNFALFSTQPWNFNGFTSVKSDLYFSSNSCSIFLPSSLHEAKHLQMKVAQAIESLKTSFRQGENSFQERML